MFLTVNLHLVIITQHLLLGNIGYNMNIPVVTNFFIQFFMVVTNPGMNHFEFYFFQRVVGNHATNSTEERAAILPAVMALKLFTATDGCISPVNRNILPARHLFSETLT
jgi:hypothetical protein